jgi:hypothetical protein
MPGSSYHPAATVPRDGRLVRRSQLAPAPARLIDAVIALHFGRISNLSIQSGEPVFDQHTTIVRTVKFGGQNSPRPEWGGRGDFLLRDAHLELLDLLKRVGTGVLRRLEVANGLPLLSEIEESAATPPTV